MSVSEVDQSKLEVLRQHITELEKGHNIGFIILVGIKISKNSRILLIVIGKKESHVSLMNLSF